MASLSPQAINYMKEHAGDDQRPNLYAALACCLILPFIAVFLRIIARRRVKASLEDDDYLIIAALVPHSAELIMNIFNVRDGLGRHVIFATNLVAFAKIFIAGEVLYTATIGLSKMSVLCLYRHLFPSRRLTIASIIVGLLVIGYMTPLIVVAFTQCIPLRKTWRPEVPGYCIDTKPAYVATGIMNVLTDVFILALPVRFVWKLHMKLSRKLQVIAVFISGGIVCIFGIIRCVAVSTVSDIDLTWSGAQGSIWSWVEMTMAIISASLPTMRPLFVKPRLENFRQDYSSTWRSKFSLSDRRTDNVQLSVASKPYVGGKMHENGSLSEAPFARLEAPEI